VSRTTRASARCIPEARRRSWQTILITQKREKSEKKISSSLAFSLLPSKKVTAQLNLLSSSHVCDVMIRECVRMCKHPLAHYLDDGAFLLRFIVTIALLRRVTFSHGHVSRKDSLHDAPFFFFIQELASSSSSFLLRSATIRQPLLNSQWRWCRYAIRLSSSFFIAAATTMPLQNYLLPVGTGEVPCKISAKVCSASVMSSVLSLSRQLPRMCVHPFRFADLRHFYDGFMIPFSWSFSCSSSKIKQLCEF